MQQMVENFITKEQEKEPMTGHYLKPELWNDFKKLAEQAGCSAEEEFCKILALGGMIDALLKKGVRVTVYVEGKEVPIENYVDPIMNKIKDQQNSKHTVP